ncbi:MAG: DUF4381 family protein [Proteobacteria bacterium]|nr:DUF4381 family protein [Pseudomonadota bacterium]
MKRPSMLLLQPLPLLGASYVLAAATDEDTLTLQKAAGQQTLKQTEALHDIHGPLPISEYPPYLVETAIVLLVLLLLALLYFFLKRRKKPLPPPVPPWERALMELAEARKLMSGGQSLLYMDQASQILRRYIELLFTIRSTRQTTREFFASLNNRDNSPLLEYQTELRACLEQADMAKFAHLVADQTHMQLMEEAVRTFISNTRPKMEPQGSRP